MNTKGDFMNAFLEELDEQMVQMEQQIVELELNGGEDDTVQTLFRVAHTLKGSSAAMGFEGMKNLTHAMEQVLDEVRHHRLKVTDSMTSLLFRCFDGLQVFRECLSDEGQPSVDMTSMIRELQQFVDTKSTSVMESVVSDGNATSRLGYEEEIRAREAVQAGLCLWEIHFKFEPSSVMRGIRAYLAVEKLNEGGEVIQVEPGLEQLEEMEDTVLEEFTATVATLWTVEHIRKVVTSSEYVEVLVNVMELEASEQSTHSEPKDNVVSKRPGAPKRRAQTIRVDVEQLESLMNLVGELVIDQARMEQVNRQLKKKYRADADVSVIGEISVHVSRVVGELQDNVMRARMLAVETLFDRFPRIVRDLSHTLQKNVRLILDGKETRLDRTVIEEIADPLIHLVRNALDHGVETEQRRVELGKTPQGTVRLAASHEDNKVVLTVQDDGAGMDPNTICQSAVKKGVISSEEAKRLTDAEQLQLIFRPGFSTSETVSDVSGRGVGMDIVLNHIEKLGGRIDIKTEMGIGTEFRITLPVTMAIITGLLMGVADRTFVVPISNVFEIVRVRLSTIQRLRGQPTIVLRGQPTPLVYLHEYFGLTGSKNRSEHVPVVVVGTSEKRVGMVVDELHGNQEVVKKSLAARVGETPGIAGATILGNGAVGLILDTAAIHPSISSMSREESHVEYAAH